MSRKRFVKKFWWDNILIQHIRNDYVYMICKLVIINLNAITVQQGQSESEPN